MLSGYCNHKELKSKQVPTDTARLCRGEGCKSYVFMVKNYGLISKSLKKNGGIGKRRSSIIERRSNAHFQQGPDSSKPGILKSRKEVAVCK